MSNYQEEHINIWSGNRIIFILEISLVRVTLVFSVSWKSLCVAFDYWNHYVNRCSPYFYKFWNCTKISEKASTMIALLFQRVFKLWQMLYSRKWKKNQYTEVVMQNYFLSWFMLKIALYIWLHICAYWFPEGLYYKDR